MSGKSPKLIINKLILVGRDKNYTVNFDVGLNIIHGDSDTGKSSILNLIDYLLGSKKVYMYDEIEKHGKYALLEVSLNGKTYTIKRDIFNTKENIEVYSSDIESMNEVFPLEYGFDYSKEGQAGYFSDFLLSSLNIPMIKVKESPSKEDSEMVRLGFRSIFKYCYFDQDEVGSRDILDRKNYSLVAKNKETFKFIHNVLDTQITEIQKEIGEKEREKKELASRYGTISYFLLETKLSTEESLYDEKENLKEKIGSLEFEKNNLTNKMRADDNEVEALRKLVLMMEKRINNLYKQKSIKENQLEQNLRLKKEYQNDINKLQTSIKVKNSLSLQHTQKVACPLCDSIMESVDIKKHFVEYNEEILKKEISSIKNRFKGLGVIIEQLRDELFLIDKNLLDEKINLSKARENLDISAEKFISPYVSQRDMLISELYTIKEKLEKIEYFLKIRKQLNEMKEKEEILVKQIDELKTKLNTLTENAPSIEEILNEIGSYLKEFLEYIPIKNAYGIRVSEKTYLPIVRERDYTELTSGGLRTLASIGYITSLLKNSLLKETNYPSLIMLDTVGKYLGKTKKKSEDEDGRKENKKEGLEDPKKYFNIYKYLENMSSNFIKKGNEHQIILVDNDFPEDLEVDYDQYVVKKFSVEEKEGYEVGFINNA
ncbi:exonuclease SbcC [Clostridium chromiireducens]|uniref:Nuclease SbcCD subunit C n=1 Tax=Clostridium chromiireducens TaxID=225345 RepID=A0A964RSD5_9CLOT|nr:AAA family ATPase [Clostridium chromiireducens]MVX66916.1 exonuclease SbcC [Clostridium chromiireducens]